MSCPLCGTRKARRRCPALGRDICPVCCATKRLTEINCPETCAYLSSAREHPAAQVKRQQAHDLAVILPTIHGMTERQHQLFFLFHTTIARHRPDGLERLLDDDVAAAAAALASTLETAVKGVIYEQTPDSRPAKRLAGELTTSLAQIREQGANVYDREAAIVLRAIERGARDTRAALNGSETAYLEVMGRLLQVNRAAQQAAGPSSSLILP